MWRELKVLQGSEPPLAMHTRSLLVSWDSPFTTYFWFIVFGTSAEKTTLICCIWKFAACQGAFPCSFQRYTGVAASNLQKMPAPFCHSVSISLNPSHLLAQESISKALHGISLPLHETTFAVCAVMLVTGGTGPGAGFGMYLTWVNIVWRSACFYWAWYRGSLCIFTWYSNIAVVTLEERQVFIIPRQRFQCRVCAKGRTKKLFFSLRIFCKIISV